jgi:hypothetical protein
VTRTRLQAQIFISAKNHKVQPRCFSVLIDRPTPREISGASNAPYLAVPIYFSGCIKRKRKGGVIAHYTAEQVFTDYIRNAVQKSIQCLERTSPLPGYPTPQIAGIMQSVVIRMLMHW